MKERTTMYLGKEDYANMDILKEKYGEMSNAAVVRLALRLAAALPAPEPRKKKQK